ncbi:hypothetical protein vseg_018297 [Gypsophila vaccaria]
MPSLHSKEYEPSNNHLLQGESLAFLDEIRDQAWANLVVYQNRMGRAYGRRVNGRELQEGQLVLRKSKAVGKGNLHGKLTATWEGPYKIVKVMRHGTYRLTDRNDNELPSHWNVDTLKKFFV